MFIRKIFGLLNRALSQDGQEYYYNKAEVDMYNELYNCKSLIKNQCPLAWEDLEETQDSSVRFCSQCQNNVYQCETVEQFLKLGGEGKCVSVIPDASHNNIGVVFLGVPNTEQIAETERQQNISISWWKKIIKNKPKFVSEEHLSKIEESILFEEFPEKRKEKMLRENGKNITKE